MRAVFVEHAEPALGVAEHHEALAEQLDAHRRAVGFGDLFGEAGRDPVAAHDLAHRRVAFDAAQQIVFFRGHRRLLRPGARILVARARQLRYLRSF